MVACSTLAYCCSSLELMCKLPRCIWPQQWLQKSRHCRYCLCCLEQNPPCFPHSVLTSTFMGSFYLPIFRYHLPVLASLCHYLQPMSRVLAVARFTLVRGKKLKTRILMCQDETWCILGETCKVALCFRQDFAWQSVP